LLYVLVIIMLVFLHFALAGTFMFRNNDPFHFGNFETSMTTLVQVGIVHTDGEG